MVRWWELVPEAVLAAGLTVFLIDETDAATSALKSTRAITLMAVVAIGWLAGRFVLSRFVRWPAVRMAASGLAAAAVLAVVVLPAYDDETVVETFPTAATATTSTTTTAPSAEPAPDASSPPPTAPAEPVRVRVGSLAGIDHRAAGTVAFYRQPDGRHVVGLEDIDVQPGPDYDVYVVPGEGRDDPGDGTRLDDLRGNKGTQYYDVPAGVALEDGPWTVLIWCQTFDVPVAASTPA